MYTYAIYYNLNLNKDFQSRFFSTPIHIRFQTSTSRTVPASHIVSIRSMAVTCRIDDAVRNSPYTNDIISGSF